MNHIAQVGHNMPPSDIEIVTERLAQKSTAIGTQLAQLKKTPVPSVIEDERLAGEITETIKQIGVIKKEVGDIHKNTKAPYLECGKAVDAWKNGKEAEIDLLRADYAKPLTAYLDKRAAEERARQIEQARIERERAEALAREAELTAKAGIAETADELLDAAISAEATANRIEDNAYTAKPTQLAKARSIYGSSAGQRLVWVGVITNISALDLNKLRQNFADDDIQKAINRFIAAGGRELDGVEIKQQTQLSVR